SEAVLSLSPAAFKILIYVAKRCYGPKRNGKVIFGARSGCLIVNLGSKRYEEHSIGLSKSVTAAALEELQEHGLLVCTKASSFDQKRHAREWRLTWVKTEFESATNDFQAFADGGKKTKRSPAGRTVKTPTVLRAGQSPGQIDGNPHLQSCGPDYSASHSPAGRTRSNHVLGTVVGENNPSALEETLEAARAETEAVVVHLSQYAPRSSA